MNKINHFCLNLLKKSANGRGIIKSGFQCWLNNSFLEFICQQLHDFRDVSKKSLLHH